VPVAAGVGHMNPRKYSLYNFIGAMVWGAGLTFAGYLLGYIPPVSDFVQSYIDLILLGAVVVTLIPTTFHYVQSTLKAKKARAADAQTLPDGQAALDPAVVDQHHDTA